MYVHSPALSQELCSPYSAEYFLSSQSNVPVLKKEDQKIIFHGFQIHCHAIFRHLVLFQIDLYVPDLKDLFCSSGPLQYLFYADKKFQHLKGLHHIILGSKLQTFYLGRNVILRSEIDHRKIFLFKIIHQGKPVFPRQHDIHKGEICVLMPQQQPAGFLPVIGCCCLISCCIKIHTEQFRNRPVVFDHQNFIFQL